MPALPPLVPKHWTLYQGDSSSMTMVVTEDGDPVDLSLYKDWSCVLYQAVDGLPPMRLAIDSTSDVDGVITVVATSTMTSTMQNYGSFELWGVHTVSDERRTFLRGETRLILRGD